MNSKRRERIIDEVEAASWLADGMTIAIGQPTPMALVRQIIKRGIKNLTIVDAGFSLDLLVGAGCVRKVVSYYAGGGFGNPVMPAFRRAAERGEIEVWECEEGILCAGLQAAAQMLPFLPWRGGVGTSLPEVNPELQVFKDPINGESLLAVPPIKPDVTILHAATADAYGNVQHYGGPGWIDLDPSNGIVGNRRHVRVAVAAQPKDAVPLQGTWYGEKSDHLNMAVTVKVRSEPKFSSVSD